LAEIRAGASDHLALLDEARFYSHPADQRAVMGFSGSHRGDCRASTGYMSLGDQNVAMQ
jgi:hypothetical protein